ncbi:DNA polymerase theta-like, partial [Saccoglossus kowalevskii]
MAAPPLDENITVTKRLQCVKSVLESTINRRGCQVTKVAIDIKQQFKYLSTSCGVTLIGNLQDPKVACWLLDPATKEKNLHRMVSNFIPDQVYLLD